MSLPSIMVFNIKLSVPLKMREQTRNKSHRRLILTTSALLHVCVPHVHVCIYDSVYKCVTFSAVPVPRERQGGAKLKPKIIVIDQSTKWSENAQLQQCAQLATELQGCMVFCFNQGALWVVPVSFTERSFGV